MTASPSEDATLPAQKAIDAVGRLDAVPGMLKILCRSTGMGFAAVARVTDRTWVACAVHDDIAFGLRPGSELDVTTTLCRDARCHDRPIFIDEASTDPEFRDHPTPSLYGIESYASVPIRLDDGSYFGNLCAVDRAPAKVNTPELRGLFLAYAQLLGEELSRALRDGGRAQAEAFQFKMLVESVTDYAIFMLDPNGMITNWNPGAARIKGYHASEIVGQHLSRFYRPEDVAAGVPLRAIETARREGRYEAEGWRVRKDGTQFWASVVIDAIHTPAGVFAGFAKITRDITEKREAQLRLEETREQLFQSQKIEALGQLTGGLAHDFNNLLTTMLGAADLAVRQRDPARIKPLLETIRNSAERGSAITRQLLAFARRQSLEPKRLDVLEQLQTAASLMRHTVPVEVELRVDVSDDVHPVVADPNQLELTLLNLAFNARDAMRSGGHLRLSARNVTLDGTPDGLQGAFVEITVSDTGTGIPAELQARVFEPFFTTKKFGEGTGLGLSQVYGFTRQSGGTVRLESKMGHGTSVTLFLPASIQGETADGAAKAVPRILVVEDNTDVADLAAMMIEDMGFAPRTVHSAHDALVTVNREGPPDLVFSDVVMPGGMSGLELAKSLRERYPELPIVLTTGYSESLANTVREFPLLPKPYDYGQLSSALERWLELSNRSDNAP